MEKWEPPYVPALLYLPKDNRDKPVEYKSSGTEFFEEEVIDFLEKQMRYFNAYIFSINIMKLAFEDNDKLKNITKEDFDDSIFIEN